MRVTIHFRRPPGVASALLAACIFAAAAPSAAAPATCHAVSGPRMVPLVELFTSEGCDSCPPADRWLSAQFPPQLPPQSPPPSVSRDRALALAFHVDYWDRLGWHDRFASAQYTQRQYDEMQANGAAFVYTPQVLVQGRDIAGWNRGKADEAIAATLRKPPRAAIALDVAPEANGLRVDATVSVAESALRKSAALWLAYVDSGHVTDVAAGENRGVRLRHDNVVRALHGPYAVDGNGNAVATLTLARPAQPGTTATIVAFVQDARNGDILQALAAPDCRDP